MARLKIFGTNLVETREAEPALRVRQGNAEAPGEQGAHCAVDNPPHGGHGETRRETIADDQRGARVGGAPQELRDVGGRVLAVAIHCQRPRKPELFGQRESVQEGGAFSARAREPDDARAGGLGLGSRAVRRSVVDHNDGWERLADDFDEGKNRVGFVVAGNESCATRRPVHISGANVNPER